MIAGKGTPRRPGAGSSGIIAMRAVAQHDVDEEDQAGGEETRMAPTSRAAPATQAGTVPPRLPPSRHTPHARRRACRHSATSAPSPDRARSRPNHPRTQNQGECFHIRRPQKALAAVLRMRQLISALGRLQCGTPDILFVCLLGCLNYILKNTYNSNCRV